MYDRIVVALDDSASAQQALGEAVKLAKVSGGVVYALSVVDRGRWPQEAGACFDFEPEPPAEENVANLVSGKAEALFRDSGVCGKVRVIEAYGESVSEVLARAAEECDADIIVIGTHGRRGTRRLLLGSVAESLVRWTEKPVLILRHDDSSGRAGHAQG